MTTRIDDDLDAELLGELLLAVPAEVPPPALKERLLKSTETSSRFEQALSRVAALCDLAADKARALLDAIDDATRWNDGPPGVQLFDIDGPRAATAVVGFVRMPAGVEFPEHTHLGDEVVLVLQGGFVDSDGTVHRAGDEVTMKANTTHSFTATPGPDLLYLVVIDKGVRFGEVVFGPGDPGM